MIDFIKQNIFSVITIIFSAGAFVTILKVTMNDLAHFKIDYDDFKKDVIDRLARIEQCMKDNKGQ